LNRVWELIAEELRAFAGSTAFEEICRTWTLRQAAAGLLPFLPDAVGRHWAPDCEVDVVALNWRQRQILLGECKWGTEAVGRSVVRTLIEEKTPRVLARLEGDWQAHYGFFARAGFTAAAQQEADRAGAWTTDLAQLDQDLRDPTL